MGKNVFLTSEGARQFSDALDLLNASIVEFSKVADKMVPEKLLINGFLDYLQEFCKVLEESSNVKFIIKNRIPELKAEESSEIILFRVMRSVLHLLLNNSQPFFIYIELDKSDSYLKIRIEDDGTNIFKQPVLMVIQTINDVSELLKALDGKLVAETNIAGNTIEIEMQLE